MTLNNALLISTLKNGMRCYVKDVETEKNTIYFALVVKSGALSDKNNIGEAHFLEHALLEFDRQKIYTSIKYKIKGVTSLDKTIFIISCNNTNENIKKIILIIKNIANGRYLNRKSIDYVRRDIKDEYYREVVIHKEYSNMYKNLLELFNISKSIPIGDIQSIEKIKFEDLVEYFNKNYTFSNMTILAVGNLNPQKILKEINELFENKFLIEGIEESIYDNLVNKYNQEIWGSRIPTIPSIHIFILNNLDNREAMKSDLIESIAITLIYELINKIFDSNIEDVKIEINQMSSRGRFIHIVIIPKVIPDNIERIIKYFCKEVFNYLDESECSKLLDEIFISYYKELVNSKIDAYQYINQITDNFVYDKPIYDNDDLIECLRQLNNEDIINYLAEILNKVIKNIDLYFFKVNC